MKEEHVRAGISSEEHRLGNEEADKLATGGVELHKVPQAFVEEVDRQDKLVLWLLTMMLNIMKSIQEKAPARKKEERQEGADPEQKYHGPKTRVHGEHCFGERPEGGWKCLRCE
eukprot:5854315-Heterocapsa_arctica.AAC.1